MEVFADGWHEAALHAFVLKAQHHDDIAAVEALGQIVERLDSEPLDVRGQQGRWRDDAHTRTHRGQEEDIRARDPARSEEHTSELQSLMRTSYAVFCLTKKNTEHHSTRFDSRH